MKVISKNDKISVFVIDKKVVDKDNINEYMKKFILKLRKYRDDIHGFYRVDVYNNKFGVCIDFIKEDDIEIFNDMVDLKIVLYDSEDIFLKFDDYFLLNRDDIYFFRGSYYVGLNNLSYLEYLSICEYCSFIYGEDYKNIKFNLKKIKV